MSQTGSSNTSNGQCDQEGNHQEVSGQTAASTTSQRRKPRAQTKWPNDIIRVTRCGIPNKWWWSETVATNLWINRPAKSWNQCQIWGFGWSRATGLVRDHEAILGASWGHIRGTDESCKRGDIEVYRQAPQALQVQTGTKFCQSTFISLDPTSISKHLQHYK